MQKRQQPISIIERENNVAKIQICSHANFNIIIYVIQEMDNLCEYECACR